MKPHQYLLIATTLVLFPGCSDAPSITPNHATSLQGDGVESEAASQDDAATLEEVKDKVGTAAEVTREFTAQEMQDYVDSLKNKLQQLDTQREQLKQKGKELAGAAKQRWEDQLSALEDKRKKLQEDLDRLAGASDHAWQDMKKGIDAAWDELKKATDEAAKEFD